MSPFIKLFDSFQGNVQNQLKIVQEMANENDLEGLRYVLGKQDPELRETAFTGLVRWSDTPGVAMALSSGDQRIRARALEYFAQTNNQDYLLKALDNSNPDVCVGATQVFARQGNINTAGLLRAMANGNPLVWQAAVSAVGGLNSMNAVSMLQSAYARGGDIFQNAVRDEFRRLLNSTDPAVASAAVVAVGGMNTVTAVNMLQDAYANGLGSIRGTVRDEFRELVSSGEFAVASAAVDSLRHLNDMDGLQQALAAPIPAVRLLVVDRLKGLRDEDGILIACSNDNQKVRSVALQILIDWKRIEKIQRVLDSNREDLWLPAVEGLRQLGATEALQKTLSHQDPEIRRAAANALGSESNNQTAVVPALEAALGNERNQLVRAAIKSALERLETLETKEEAQHSLRKVLRIGLETITVLGVLEQLLAQIIAIWPGHPLSSVMGYPVILVILPASLLFAYLLTTEGSGIRGSSSHKQALESQGLWQGLKQRVWSSIGQSRRLRFDVTILLGAAVVMVVFLITAIVPMKSNIRWIVVSIALFVIAAIVVVVSKQGRTAARWLVASPVRWGVFAVAVIAIIISVVVGPSGILLQHPASPGFRFAEYSISTKKAQPTAIVVGPDGNLWFTEFKANKIGRITLKGTIAEFPIIRAQSGPSEMVLAPDGSLWFTEVSASRVGEMAEPVKAPTPLIGFQIPEGAEPEGITARSDGVIWLTEKANNKIACLTPGGICGEYPIPTLNSAPTGITVGPDGALWFTETNSNQIGRMTVGGTFNEYPIPTANSAPAGIAAGPDGALWFTESLTDKIGRISIAGKITEYPIPTANSAPWRIAATSQNGMWFTEAHSDKIGRITLAGAITEYHIPTANSAPSGIIAGPDGAIWFTEAAGDKIGRLTISN